MSKETEFDGQAIRDSLERNPFDHSRLGRDYADYVERMQPYMEAAQGFANRLLKNYTKKRWGHMIPKSWVLRSDHATPLGLLFPTATRVYEYLGNDYGIAAMATRFTKVKHIAVTTHVMGRIGAVAVPVHLLEANPTWVVDGGYVVSQTDGDHHEVPGSAIARLYGLQRAQYRTPESMGFRQGDYASRRWKATDILLKPRYDGMYVTIAEDFYHAFR